MLRHPFLLVLRIFVGVAHSQLMAGDVKCVGWAYSISHCATRSVNAMSRICLSEYLQRMVTNLPSSASETPLVTCRPIG